VNIVPQIGGAPQQSLAWTDVEGRFSFAAKAPGNYRIVVRHAVHGHATKHLRDCFGPSVVQIGDFHLAPTTELSGIVTYPDGTPIADCVVQVVHRAGSIMETESTGAYIGTTNTGASGLFRFEGLAPESYSLQVLGQICRPASVWQVALEPGSGHIHAIVAPLRRIRIRSEAPGGQEIPWRQVNLTFMPSTDRVGEGTATPRRSISVIPSRAGDCFIASDSTGRITARHAEMTGSLEWPGALAVSHENEVTVTIQLRGEK
jgi:hypothetical protein